VVHVTSEIGRLRQVLLHEPGPEVDRMVPAMMEELLFDDILFGNAAREEHRRVRKIMQLLGIEVLEVRDLLVETMQNPAARDWVLEVLLEGLSMAVAERMRNVSAKELATMLVSGVRQDPSQAGIEVDELYELPPLPNWCFQRDPQVIMGDGVVFSAMAMPARWRESLLARAIFHHHPRFASVPVLHDPLQPVRDRPLYLGPHHPRIEGGDVLVLSRDVIAIGYSERTNRTGVQHLAKALALCEGGPRWLIVVALPQRRAYMHLDTVVTAIDRDLCLIYAPVLLPGGSEEARVYEIDLHSRDQQAVSCAGFLSALALRGLDLEPVLCGGSDAVAQQREQWTDGANAFALAPGFIMLYDRNVGTAEQLARRGFRVVDARDVLKGKHALDLQAGERVCVLLPSHELSRARGGPHCLAHPLVRDDVR
jgi:arginine deiminase